MKLQSPQLPLVLELADTALMASETSMDRCRFAEADWSGRLLYSVGLDEVVIDRSNLSESKFERLSAQDVRCANSDLSASQCPEVSLQRVGFKSGRMTGWNCNKGLFKDVTFDTCKLNLANFRYAKFIRVRFVSCVMTDADFLGCEMADVNFEDCLLERTNFNHCKLKNVDLRTSQLLDLKGWQSLKGAVIDDVQLMAAAPYLANEIGIRVLS